LLDQLKLLEELQQLDAKLHETEDSRTSLEVKLKSLKEDVGRVEILLEAERQQLADARRYREELEATIKAEQEQLNKSKLKLQQVRTSKEYMASQREVDGARKSSTEREEELIKLMDAVEAFQKSIKVHEEELAQLKQAVDEEEKQTAIKIEGLEGERKKRVVARDKLAATVRKDVLAKYETIRRRRGLAVVPARNGVCTGCNMHLPPQLYNILHGANSIEHCPSCQRIVYFIPEAGH
jgi:predicted  nucleic acid-binding Zn-ribbon protein